MLSGTSWGYARVSTEDQNLKMQLNALLSAGLREDQIITDQESGTNTNRPGYRKILKLIQGGYMDHLWIYRMDRLGRDHYELCSLLQVIERCDVTLISICEPFVKEWNRSSWAFRAMWEAIGDARYELLRLKERQRAGIDAARAAGKHLGRPRAK